MRVLRLTHYSRERTQPLHSTLCYSYISAQAIKYYGMTHGILRKHSHVSSFAAILRETEEIMAGLRTKLEAKVAAPGVSQAPFVETVSLLLKLGANRPALRDKFVSYHVRLFGEWFEASRRSVVADPKVPTAISISL